MSDELPDQLADGQDALKVDVVVNYMFNKVKKTFEQSYVDVHQNLLRNISVDYGHDLEELKEKYPFTVTAHKKKPKDPTQICQAYKKNGDPCTFTRKEGFDFCGTHLKTNQSEILDNPISERGKVKKTLNLTKSSENSKNEKGNYTPKEDDPKVEFKPRYQPRSEEETENQLTENQLTENYQPREELTDQPQSPTEEDEVSNPQQTSGSSSLNSSMQSDQEIEIDVEEIEGEKYLTRNQRIYYMPENTEDVGFRDLKLAGTRQEDGTIKWRNQRIKMKN